MTRTDRQFLEANRITPEDIKLPTWQEWRDDEVRLLRARLIETENLGIRRGMERAEERMRKHMWRLAAVIGWGLFAMVLWNVISGGPQ